MRPHPEPIPRLLESTLSRLPRLLLVLAALCLVPVYLLPLWNMTMFAPQYPDGLRLDIYSWKLSGAHAGQDVREVNVLNHYIGMHDLQTSDFTEFKWMPFVLGALGLLFLRAAVHGLLGHALDVLVLYLYFTLFSLWSFGFKLWSYGHELAPTAAVKVAPFMPPLFGHKKLANFDVYSYPAPAAYALGAVAVVLAVAFVLGWRASRKTAGAPT
jgi:copper chaperone NosL